MNLKIFLGFALLVLTTFSCTEYRKVLKTDDMQYKYDMALEYYKAEKFAKALPLLDELFILYRGSEKGEKIAYYLAKCEFGMKDYISSGYRFGQFHKSYPRSEYSEEAQFLSAFCNYKLSPKYSLDQRETFEAIKSFQLFAIQRPESRLIDSVNILLDELRYKLELKDYKAAKLYFKREQYRAAKVALTNFNKRYPNSKYKEETWFLWLESTYLLSINSVEEKKMERVEDAMNAYITFADRFPTSSYLKEAGEMNAQLEKLNLELKES